MTNTIVNYLSQRETARANVANEKLKQSQIEEEQRHNLRAEQLTAEQNYNTRVWQEEQARHNLMSETLQQQEIAEKARHNTVQELISYQQNRLKGMEVANASRSIDEVSWLNHQNVLLNEIKQEEVVRHNLFSEQIMAKEAGIKSLLAQQQIGFQTSQIGLEQQRIGFQYQSLAETERHNKYTEETQRRSTTSQIITNALSNVAKSLVLFGY